MKQGWVRIHRCIEDNPLWLSESFTKAQAWVDLFLMANHTDGKVFIRGNGVDIKRGQLGWSELTMVKRWGWSKNKVRRFLKYLETEQQIRQQKDRFITTIITIINYEIYQSDTADDTAKGQQKDSRRYINKKNKNVNNEKKDIDTPNKKDLSGEDLSLLADQLNVDLEVVKKTYDRLIDYIASTGKTYKDYRATIRNWVRTGIEDGKIKVIDKNAGRKVKNVSPSGEVTYYD